MKFLLIFLACLSFTLGKAQQINYALELDGLDNDLRIGMDTINTHWTLEAWIKGNDNNWREQEVIIGGGEYANLDDYDYYPLVIRNGRVHSNFANISSTTILDSNWHHIAVTCNGKTTSLYLDGVEEASANKATSIIPGCVGSNTEKDKTFAGLIDEVRIWEQALSSKEINKWKNRALDAEHPAFSNLKGYYTFDDYQKEMSVNLVGRSVEPYHLIITRIDKYGTVPLAKHMVNRNPHFKKWDKNMKLFSAVCQHTEWDSDQGAKDEQLIKLRLVVHGDGSALKLRELNLDFSETDVLSDISKVRVYYTGKSAHSSLKEKLFEIDRFKSAKVKFTKSASEAKVLSAGINYFLVTIDVKPNAEIGHALDAKVSSFKLNNKVYVPQDGSSIIKKEVNSNSTNNPNIYRVLSWNIWHGGRHLGDVGPQRVKDIVKATNADVVLMQESYGSQKMIADSAGYLLYTPGNKDNLAIHSKQDQFEPIDSKVSTFKSIGIKTKAENKQMLAVFDWWLPYAYRPEYTSVYLNQGLDTNIWIDEDKALAVADAEKIISLEIDSIVTDLKMPVIVGGDFNTFSHQDWTKEAAEIHYGYGPVDFPTSHTMLNHGFIDSYRERNPNEVTHPGGTWAASMGFLNARIDFIYYKGDHITTQASKIIRNPKEIDDVWPGDHAAVLSTFRLMDKKLVNK
ncbi:endonuclease [Ancylomarina euxinus]|uniref:Endonuclease n=1 Tax=Ancylomarina euxinus TaxID=2283627 RepID=A0A425XX72_9BACT|nr:LamG-like jellyroll fold domain-containing protein [Ancylomarina euxinus]MCZ4696191.1 endonuclease/exonuclease/phosphatase family protein [Ancylomarina euxinus]MUP16445.1 endonuclease [Ancylomarina euxinus]RRG19234.1 endonuclease [Ancylomarina euxinus]